MKRILLIDDDAVFLESVRDFLTLMGYDVHPESNPIEAVNIFAKFDFDCVICDLAMPIQSGEETIKQIRAHSLDIKIIAISGGFKELDEFGVVELLGANHFLEKPFRSGNSLIELIESPEAGI